MDSGDSMKALYVVVNAGFADEIIDIMRAQGAGGATIMNARGEGITHRSFLGITVDSEREVVLSLVNRKTSDKILKAVKEKAGLKSPAHGVAFVIPVDKVIGLNRPAPLPDGN